MHLESSQVSVSVRSSRCAVGRTCSQDGGGRERRDESKVKRGSAPSSGVEELSCLYPPDL